MPILQVPDWKSGCRFLYGNRTEGLVDGFGNPMAAFDYVNGTTWGITIDTCYKYCGTDKLQQSFNFSAFSTSFTNWLLPWLALTAQLPYEGSGPWTNFMSLALALGSPSLITYSLSLTILNRFWIRQRFASLRSENRAVSNRHAQFSDRIKAAQYLLQEAQQVPMRASQEGGWLSSLIVLDNNQRWWTGVKKDLRNTRRGVTFSLVAQVGAAVTAWLFTIIAAFVGNLGDIPTALQISSGAIWLWMVPVICGWIAVGTQYRTGSIVDALQDESDHAFRALPDTDANGKATVAEERQRAIVSRSGLTPQPHRVLTFAGKGGNEAYVGIPPGRIATNDYARLQVPNWFGFDVAGDEKEEGPLYNYARPFTWWQFASAIEQAFAATLSSLRSGDNCQEKPWDINQRLELNLAGTSTQVAKYSGFATRPIPAYPEWKDISAKVWHRMLVASLLAVFVQFGTTGPAIFVAYLTPTVGLSCRSGSYLIYGVLGTVSWILLVTSTLFSHAVMLRYQRKHESDPTCDLRENTDQPGSYRRTRSHSFLCAAAVITSATGKFLAACNALFLVTSSIFEYVGVYENCWCAGDAASLGDKGWIVLFKNAQDLSDAASRYWVGGIILSFAVCFLSFLFFYFGCRTTDDDES